MSQQVQTSGMIKLDVATFGRVAYEEFNRGTNAVPYDQLNTATRGKWEAVGAAVANHVNTVAAAMKVAIEKMKAPKEGEFAAPGVVTKTNIPPPATANPAPDTLAPAGQDNAADPSNTASAPVAAGTQGAPANDGQNGGAKGESAHGGNSGEFRPTDHGRAGYHAYVAFLDKHGFLNPGVPTYDETAPVLQGAWTEAVEEAAKVLQNPH